jgi:hypothetical protein
MIDESENKTLFVKRLSSNHARKTSLAEYKKKHADLITKLK